MSFSSGSCAAPRVLCVGEVLFDRLAAQPAESVEAVTHWHSYPGGAPANVACALVKLGTIAGFLGCIGQEAAGEELKRLLSDIGVDLTGLQEHPTAPTRIVEVLRNAQGDRRFAGFCGQPTSIFADTFFRGEAIPDRCFEAVELLVTGTLGLATPQSAQGIEMAIHRTRRAHGEIVVDVNWRPMFWESTPAKAVDRIKSFLTHAHWLKLTDEEANLLFHSQDLEQIQSHYPDLKGILLTLGAGGCSYWLHGHQGHVPAFAVPALDTTGAGDSFLAGFIHQLLNPPDLTDSTCSNTSSASSGAIDRTQNRTQALADPVHCQKIVTYASAIGALTTLKPGAIDAQPSPQDLKHFLALQDPH